MRKLSANAILLFGGDAAARALGFLATVHLARTLGSESFGGVIIGLSVLSYALWFSDLGLTTLGTREMARPREAREHSPGEILTTRLILSLIVFIAMQGVALVLYPTGATRTVVALYLLTVPAYALSLEWYFQGAQRFGLFTLSKFVTTAVYFTAIILAVAGPADAPLVPLFNCLGALVAATILLAARRDERLIPAGFSMRRFTTILRHAGTIGVGGIFAQTVQLLPPIILGLMATDADAGVLGAAMKIVFVILMIDRVFAAIFLPAISKLFAAGPERVREHLELALALIIVLGFGMAALVTAHARDIMRLVYNDSYRGGALALAIMSWFAAATLVNSVFAYGLIGAGEERAYLRATVTGGSIAALLTVAMIAAWGLTGGAIAMTAGEVVMVILAWLAFRRRIPLRFARPLVVAALLAAGIVAAAHALDMTAIWFAPLLGIAFLLAAYLLGAFRRDDILWLMKR
jgi:O-antigen/teichoic acid export membrane protein